LCIRDFETPEHCFILGANPKRRSQFLKQQYGVSIFTEMD